ncbi:MAG: glycosyltransferase family 4 protein [Desulfobacterales bacterium]|nr:glycosyltransferase family 4 protein [Desulfobacterales bacterium]
MRIVFIGQKGIPAKFGGVECHVDKLSRGLAARHHQVSVYVRPWYDGKRLKEYDGVKLASIPTLKTKHLDASIHCLLSSVHCLFVPAEIVHYHGIGPSFFSLIPRLFGRKIVTTIHRLDWATGKWGKAAKLFLKAGEWVSVRLAHQTIVVSTEIKKHVCAVYKKDAVFIPNGVQTHIFRPLRIIKQKYNLSSRQYILFLGRLVPEKRPDMLIQVFRELSSNQDGFGSLKLVISGGSSATDDYVRKLRKLAGSDPRVIFTGYVWGEEKEELLSHALLFVLPSYLEGYPISLLEAKSYGLCCLASDIDAHKEVIRNGQSGKLFHAEDSKDLQDCLVSLIEHPEEIQKLGKRAQEDIQNQLTWDEVVNKTISVYLDALKD